MQLRASERRHIQKDYIERDRAAYDDSESCQRLPDMRGECRAKRLLLFWCAPCCEKGRGFVEASANIEPQRSDDETEQERRTPAPAVKRLGRQNARDQGAQQRACEHSQALAD